MLYGWWRQNRPAYPPKVIWSSALGLAGRRLTGSSFSNAGNIVTDKKHAISTPSADVTENHVAPESPTCSSSRNRSQWSLGWSESASHWADAVLNGLYFLAGCAKRLMVHNHVNTIQPPPKLKPKVGTFTVAVLKNILPNRINPWWQQLKK